MKVGKQYRRFYLSRRLGTCFLAVSSCSFLMALLFQSHLFASVVSSSVYLLQFNTDDELQVQGRHGPIFDLPSQSQFHLYSAHHVLNLATTVAVAAEAHDLWSDPPLEYSDCFDVFCPEVIIPLSTDHRRTKLIHEPTRFNHDEPGVSQELTRLGALTASERVGINNDQGNKSNAYIKEFPAGGAANEMIKVPQEKAHQHSQGKEAMPTMSGQKMAPTRAKHQPSEITFPAESMLVSVETLKLQDSTFELANYDTVEPKLHLRTQLYKKSNVETPATTVTVDVPHHVTDHSSPQLKPNSTAQERVNWLREDWGNIKIFSSDELAKKFPKRMKDFLNEKCEMQFFMTWIGPLSAFGPRERVALESVFKAHPSACLVILSRSLDTSRGREILHPLVNRGFRILAITPHVPFLMKSTPAESWLRDLRKGLIDPGEIPFNQNLSNLLRLLVLHKYGGVYLDTDMIIMKSFANLSNAIGAQSLDRSTGKWNRLNNAVMIFDKGSPLVYKFIQEFSLTFNGSKWGHNGPYLVSRVVMRRPDWACKILEPLSFYPVDWDHIAGFFHAPRNDAERHWMMAKMAQLSQHSYAIHLWNKLSRSLEVEPGSIMHSIFQKSCVICDTHTYDSALKAAA